MMTDLKPCPFCGGKAKIYATTTGTYPNHGKHFCYCEKCYTSGPSFSDFENDGSSLFKAVEAWNRRAGDAIEKLQADVAPVVRGHWISTKEAEEMGDIMKEFTCSVCGCCEWDCTESKSFNFCPNCGADMRPEEGE